jgi:rfaE bifunctional protein nucleotidyltransferase chain/domain
VKERSPLPAIALHTDTSALTAIGNDYGYDQVFARPLLALGKPNDVLIAITTSGKSPNVVAAVKAARTKGMKVLGLTGARGAEFIASCDGGVAVPTTITARIQELHITIGHMLCEYVDADADALQHRGGKELDRSALQWLANHARATSRTIVWTNGVFDLVHAGHLKSLRAARALGDILVVGINSDASVRVNKGEERPLVPEAERAGLIAELECVDYVHVFSELTPVEAITALRPHVHCKGTDYAPPNGKPVPERTLVESYGGRVEYIDIVAGRSSTALLERLRTL